LSTRIIYPPELEIKETTDTASSETFLDVYLEFDDSGHLSTKIYDKRDDFNLFLRHTLTKKISLTFFLISLSLYIFTIWKCIAYNRFCRDDIYVTEYGTALTTILPIFFLYLIGCSDRCRYSASAIQITPRRNWAIGFNGDKGEEIKQTDGVVLDVKLDKGDDLNAVLDQFEEALFPRAL
jgi:hypothetical protein